MDKQDIKETDIWTLYDRSVSYCHMLGMFTDTDKNYRMYNGDQWQGLKIQGVEKVQFNFIKPTVRYKTGVILTNLFAVVFSSQNYENREFRKNAVKICELLNKKAARIWENDYMDLKLRRVVKDAAINDEGVIYVNFSQETGLPVNEIINKTDVYYGNENDADIQSQPYILIKQRKPVSEVQEIALANGVSAELIKYIHGDGEITEEAGESAKYEKDDMCTLVTKFYKHNGTVHFSRATRYVDIKADTDSGLTLYPIAHVLWEERKGSARGEGEVRQLIPNQLETNKTAMRRAVTTKNTAYPSKVANIKKISNPDALNKVGTLIKVNSDTVDDVSKVFTNIFPAQMSPDVEKLQNELIQNTRELAGAGEIATGQINPENASGRAVLAIKQAVEQPLTEHLQYTKSFVENLARIWFDIITVYNDSIKLEMEVFDEVTGEVDIVLVDVPQVSLKELQASVKVDITPKSAYDKYAQEQSIENLLTGGYLTNQRMPELEIFVSLLDDDSSMPKQKLEEAIKKWKADQQKIAELHANSQRLMQNAQQYMNLDPDGQVEYMLRAMQQTQAQY